MCADSPGALTVGARRWKQPVLRCLRMLPDRSSSLPVKDQMTPSRASISTLIRSARGAFDLPSVMVGVLVVGILGAGVFAAVFGVIPWAQNRAAMQDLSSLIIAEGAAKSVDGQYAGPALMKEFGYLGNDAGLDYAISDDASCYVGVAKAASGRTFFTVNGSNPEELTRETEPECLEPLGTTPNPEDGTSWVDVVLEGGKLA